MSRGEIMQRALDWN